ncbi:MAG: redoxin domain-containing protein [Candidatus Zixiibacteriota bacterium]|nr:MAG: redoxin domain-containing protein [candidate division Zixibacteria bacterium]
MTENTRPSVKSIVLYGIAIIVVAFIGVLAGNWFVQWRSGQQSGYSPESWEMANRSLLRKGELFPNENVTDLDSNIVNTESLLAGHKTLILLISPGCEPCEMAIKDWIDDADGVAAEYSVLGIGVGEVEDIRAYKEKTSFPFPLYADVDYLYPQQYDLISFPTMIGLNEESKVALVLHGYREDVSLTDACKMIDDLKL